MKYNRITPRLGIIEDSAKILARDYPYESSRVYREKICLVLDQALDLGNSRKRKAYYSNLSVLGKTRLFNAIAEQAESYDRRFNRLSLDKRAYPIIIGSYPAK